MGRMGGILHDTYCFEQSICFEISRMEGRGALYIYIYIYIYIVLSSNLITSKIYIFFYNNMCVLCIFIMYINTHRA